MKKTMNIDRELLKQARELSGAKTDTEVVQMALQSLIRREASLRMLAFAGSEPNAQDVPRRREKPKSKRRAA